MRKSFIFLLVFILVPASVFLTGFAGPAEQPPESVKKVDVERTPHPFSISIDKPSIKLVTDPGSTKDGIITIQNNGLKALEVRVYAADWTYAGDGSKTFHKAGFTNYSCANWIHLNPRSILLNPLDAEEIKYVITTPKNASGGHAAVIFFESVFKEEEGIVLGGRIGTIVYQETKGKTTKSGSIESFEATYGGDKKTVNLKAIFKNTGNSHLITYPKAEIYSKDGR